MHVGRGEIEPPLDGRNAVHVRYVLIPAGHLGSVSEPGQEHSLTLISRGGRQVLSHQQRVGAEVVVEVEHTRVRGVGIHTVPVLGIFTPGRPDIGFEQRP